MTPSADSKIRRRSGRPAAAPASSVSKMPDRVADRRIAVRMGWFFLRYLGRLYREFEGDFLMAMVLGEVAHHNICHYYSSGRKTSDDSSVDWESSVARNRMEPCNAFSLSSATGIPRETVRRKIRQLIEREWLVRHPDGGYVLGSGVLAHFADGFNRCQLDDLLDTADDLKAILRESSPGPSALPGKGPSRGGRPTRR